MLNFFLDKHMLLPLSGEQFSSLEQDVLENGCYTSIIVNEEMVIVDGHNRFRICEKNNLPFQGPRVPGVRGLGTGRGEGLLPLVHDRQDFSPPRQGGGGHAHRGWGGEHGPHRHQQEHLYCPLRQRRAASVLSGRGPFPQRPPPRWRRPGCT